MSAPAGTVSSVRIGLNLGYWGMGNDSDNLALAVEAETLGFSVVWAAEAYGSDAPTVLAYVAARTERIDVGSAVMQIPARSPAMTAMTAATLDTLSRGRFRLGLGISGPQVSEGWHGVRFEPPLARTREYVDIVRLALDRRRVAYTGAHYQLPLPDGPGRALRLTIHPVREGLPIYLAAVGPKNVELAGEIADGWLGIFVAPRSAPDQVAQLRAGRKRRGDGSRDLSDFDVVASAPLVIGEDVEACAAPIRGYAALYLGGMGSRTANFYHAQATRMGYGPQADAVQDRYLDRDHQGAAAAVPLEFIDSTSLLGPVPRIAERIAELSEAGVTTVSVTPHAPTLPERLEALHGVAAALEQSGTG